MKLVVTGGAGFIGSHYVRTLLQTDRGSEIAQLTVVDLLTYAGNAKNLDPVRDNVRFSFTHGDINDSNLMTQLLAEADAVVHFAAESHVDRSIAGSSEFIRTNINGTHVLLEAARLTGLSRFLHVSTDEVYGTIQDGSWTEASPLLPNSPYAASKASSDLLVRSYNRTYGLDVVTTRCSNNYGQYQFPEKLIPLFATNLIDGIKLPLYGNGLNIRDWLHVDDHCNGIHLALLNGKAGNVYNIGGGTELTNIEMTELILDAFGAKWDESVTYVDDRQGHDLRYSVDWSKANRDLGYMPEVQFEQGLNATIQWYRDNESWWRPLKKEG
jgi:dTDP-glucose 4,6-dehydratase